MSKVIKQSWHLFDAKSQIVGRLSQHVATVLMGKHKPTYTPNVDCGDTVVVVNVKDIKFTGRKWDQKIYRRHTGYVGNLKEVPAIEWRNRAPERVLLHAVRGMIPKTKHKLNQMARLKVYPGPEHPFQAMFPNHPVSLEQVQAQTVALTDTWDFPADFPEDIKRKVLSRVEYKVDSRLIPQLKLVTKQYE